MEKLKTQNSIYCIQYLRGIAALAVLAAHSLEHPLSQSTRNIIVTGRFGVILFFVISGFIMVIVTGHDRFNTRIFLTKRFIRVVPYYWIITLFTVILALMAPYAFKATTVTISHVLTSIFFIPFNPDGGSLPIIKLGWTLNYEIFFYITFSMLAIFSLKIRLVLLYLIFVILVIIGQFVEVQNSAVKFYTNFIIISFIGGATIGYIYLKININNTPSWLAYLVFLILILFIIAAYVYQRDYNYISNSSTTIMMTSCCCCIFIGLWIEDKEILFKSKIMATFGNASYSIYLTHLFGVGAVFVICKKYAVNLDGIGYFITVTSGFMAGVFIGILSYFYIEKPVIEKMKVFLGYR